MSLEVSKACLFMLLVATDKKMRFTMLYVLDIKRVCDTEELYANYCCPTNPSTGGNMTY